MDTILAYAPVVVLALIIGGFILILRRAVFPELNNAFFGQIARLAPTLFPIPDPARERPISADSPLATYNSFAQGMADRINARFSLNDDSTILCNDGGFMRIYRATGADVFGADIQTRALICERINTALRGLEEGWALWISLDQYPVREYPNRTFPDLASWLVEQERRRMFLAGNHHTNDSYWTFYYRPRPQLLGRQDRLIETDDIGSDKTNARALFHKVTGQIVETLRATIELEELQRTEPPTSISDQYPVDERRAMLLRAATGRREQPRALPRDAMLNYSIAETVDADSFKPYIRIGSMLARPLSIVSFPEETTPEILDLLRGAGMNMHVTWRYVALSTDQAKKLVRVIRGWHLQQRYRIGDILSGDAYGGIDDRAKANAGDDAEDAYGIISDEYTSISHFALVATLFEPIGQPGERPGEDTAQQRVLGAVRRLAANYSALSGALSKNGFSVPDDWGNELDAFYGTIPGNVWDNLVAGEVTTRSLANMIPTTFVHRGVSHGPREYGGKDAPPLALFTINRVTPYYLNLHYKNMGGMTLVVADTGAGKSTVTGFIVANHRNYCTLPKGAQQFIIDRARQHYVLTTAVGGAHIEVGPKANCGFAPLGELDDPDEFLFAANWLAILIHEQGLDPAQYADEVQEALVRLRRRERDQWTLSGFLSTAAISETLREKLRMFARGGIAGGLFDAPADAIPNASLVTFELDPLPRQSQLYKPAMIALFHAISRRTRAAIPTLLVGEEWWAILKDPFAASILEEEIRTMRRRNVAIMMLTQSYSDLLNLNGLQVIVESCSTKLVLPSKGLLSNDYDEIFRTLKVDHWQRRRLADKIGEPYMLVVQPDHDALVYTGLGPIARATCGSTSNDDVLKVQELMRTVGAHWYEQHVTSKFPPEYREGWARLMREALNQQPDSDNGRILAGATAS